MNDRIEHLINGLAGRNALLDSAMKASATWLIVVVAVVLLALWFWPAAPAVRATNQRVVLAAVLSALAALAIGALIGSLYNEARPFVSDPSTHQLVAHAADSGMPSDHALASFGVAGVLLWWRRALGVLLVAVGTLIGVARVYVGIHWPGDIVAGAAVGLLCGALLAQTVPWWQGPQRWGSRVLPTWLVGPP